MLATSTTLPLRRGDSNPAMNASVLLLENATWLRCARVPDLSSKPHQRNTRWARSASWKLLASPCSAAGMALAHCLSRGWLPPPEEDDQQVLVA